MNLLGVLLVLPVFNFGLRWRSRKHQANYNKVTKLYRTNGISKKNVEPLPKLLSTFSSPP